MASRCAVDPVPQITCRFEARQAAEVARFVLAAVVGTEIEQLALGVLPAHLSKSEVRLEWTAEVPGELSELRAQCRIGGRHGRCRVLVIPFPREEVVELVFDERPAEADARLRAVIRGVGCQRGKLKALLGCPTHCLG